MNDLFTYGVLCFTSFFTLINPLGVMPIFLTMTSELNEKERTRTARKASIVSFFIIIAFAFTGQLLFNFFGISVNGFRVAGGVIFFMMGMDMLQARLSPVKIKDSEVKSYINDISVTPLAIPMLCGPGALTNAIVLMEDAASAWRIAILIFSVVLVMSLSYLILFSASKIIKVIGDTGINVMMRIMGLIVMVIAVEFFFAGIKPVILDIIKMSTHD
jgi:multiple antibiotic resistance protein